jgi:hypothetical protein
MSGGHYDYKQHYLNDLIEDLGEDLKRVSASDSSSSMPYPATLITHISKTITHLTEAYNYLHHLDWYFSGDTSQETMESRIAADTAKLPLAHLIEVRFLSPTDYLGARVKLHSHRYNESITINYDHNASSVQEIALDYLTKRGFNIIVVGELKSGCIIATSTFRSIKTT